MAKKFSVKEAKDLLSYARSFLRDFEAVLSLSRKYDAQAHKQISKAAEMHALTSYTEESLLSRDTKLPVHVQIVEMVHALLDTEQADELTAKARTLEKLYVPSFTKMMEDLSPAANVLKWVFASGKTKTKAEKAFTKLDAFLVSRNAEEMTALVKLMEEMQSDASDVDELLLKTPAKLMQLYEAHNSKDIHDTKGVGEVRHVVRTMEALEYELKRSSDLLEQSRQKVRSETMQIVTKEMLKLLQDVPVDHINRSRKGYRIASLKGAGILTVADLYQTKTAQIAEINGISDYTAELMKNEAQAIAEDTAATIRIRLSADDRNDDSTALIRAIEIYRRKLLVAGDIRRLRREHFSNNLYAIRKVKEIDDGVRYVFANQDTRRKLLEAYLYLKEASEGEFIGRVYDLFNELENTSEVSAEEAWNRFVKDPVQFYTVLEEIVPGVLGNEDSVYGLPEDLAKEIAAQEVTEDGLKCTLRRYQSWGVKYILHQKRVLLGDEMGLGKTVQAIASMVALRNTGASHFIVVCPASVLPNWCKEIAEKSHLKPIRIHGATRMHMWKLWIEEGGVAVTTFETTGNMKLEENFKVDMMIVDEAHYIKNPEALRTLNVKELAAHAERMLFMTGTALENRVNEMLSLLAVLQPEIASEARSIAFMASADQFREKIAPVYYRRKREDVLSELPELIDNREWVSLSVEENRIYEDDLKNGSYADIRQVSWNIGDLDASSKAERMMEIIDEAKAEERKIIVFSYFLHTIHAVCDYLGTQCMEPIIGSVSPQKRQEIIDAFNNAPAGTVLPAQIVSGGTGLNIQAASVVILCEPQLKPSIENQAISRAYRMGQARNVLVYRLLADNTVDERIMELLAEKQNIFDAFADSSVAGEASLKQDAEVDETTFAQIVKEEIARIEAMKKEGQQ